VNDQKKSSGSPLILIGAVVVVGLVLVFVFFNPFEGNENTERTSIRLGTTISETGRLSPEAKLYIDGRQFAIDRINDQGGIKVGDDIYPLELVQFDDQSDADTAVRLYESMIERNQVDFLLGLFKHPGDSHKQHRREVQDPHGSRGRRIAEHLQSGF